MNKSVYSIVLMDEVIRAVDERAYRLGTNRSNLINQILAEHLSCITPEMRMRTIFDAVSELIGTSCIQQQSSAAMLTLRTAIEYKYRPTISYKVELERIPCEHLGRLKINIRTQSPELTELFGRFFASIAEIEIKIALKKGYGGFLWEVSRTSCARHFINTETLSDGVKGEAIGNYITLLNKAVKLFFTAPDSLGTIEKWYKEEFVRFTDKYML